MGKWLSEGGTGTPHYVVNPDHIARLLAEGYLAVPDPRIPTEETQEEAQEPEKDEVDDDTTRRLTTTKAANKSRARSVDTTL